MPLDIGVGILLSLYTAHAFGLEPSAPLIFFGIAAALLPDIDAVTMLWGKWKHRQLTHYPLFWLPWAVAVYLLLGPAYAFLFFTAVYAHLVHDTFGLGWGISWLWPLTKRRFLILPEQARRKHYGPFMTFMPEEIPTIREEPTKHGWIVQYYLRPSILGAIEYGVLLLGLVALLLTVR